MSIRNYDVNKILDNVEDAYNAYLNKEHLELSYSKMFTEYPGGFIDEIEKNKPFLVFAGRSICIDFMVECSFNYSIFVFYTNTFTRTNIHRKFFDSLDFVEYSILKTAKDVFDYTVVKFLESVYERTRKYVKVLDFENKKYVYEILDEKPVFSII